MSLTVQYFASPAALEHAQLIRGADMSVAERLRELQRLNAQIFAPLRLALRGQPARLHIFQRLPQESDEDFSRRVAQEKEQWTYSMRKVPR